MRCGDGCTVIRYGPAGELNFFHSVLFLEKDYVLVVFFADCPLDDRVPACDIKQLYCHPVMEAPYINDERITW